MQREATVAPAAGRPVPRRLAGGYSRGTRSKTPYFDHMTKCHAHMKKTPVHVSAAPDCMTKTLVHPSADRMNVLRGHENVRFSAKSKYPSFDHMTKCHVHVKKKLTHVIRATNYMTQTTVRVPAERVNVNCGHENGRFSGKSKYPSFDHVTKGHPQAKNRLMRMVCSADCMTKMTRSGVCRNLTARSGASGRS
jgi:hypothetical protein